LGAVKTIGIIEEPMEIWPNEVCDMQTSLERYTYAPQPKTWRCDILGFSPVKIS